MIKLENILQFLGLLMLVLVSSGCGSKVETTRIDCQLNDITITHDLTGTVSHSGDMVTGSITILCAGAPVKDVTITGSAGWWYLGSVGPSNDAGVISVAKPAEALGRRDIGTTKAVDIIVNAFQGGSEDSKKFPISIPIS